jgi:hypothetical protein
MLNLDFVWIGIGAEAGQWPPFYRIVAGRAWAIPLSFRPQMLATGRRD